MGDWKDICSMSNRSPNGLWCSPENGLVKQRPKVVVVVVVVVQWNSVKFCFCCIFILLLRTKNMLYVSFADFVCQQCEIYNYPNKICVILINIPKLQTWWKWNVLKVLKVSRVACHIVVCVVCLGGSVPRPSLVNTDSSVQRFLCQFQHDAQVPRMAVLCVLYQVWFISKLNA